MSKFLKSKYFSKSCIFQAKTKPRDSWLWRSWNEAKALIKEGCCWQVGNGSSINIWDDKWLIEKQGNKVNTVQSEACNLTKVKDLMHQNKAGWNVELLRQTFSDDEVQIIQRIPTSALGVTDRMIWIATKYGQFSVTSGYELAKLGQRRAAGEEGLSSRVEQEEDGLWKKVWNMDIKKKVQHFIWRACHNKLPVGVSLQKRGIGVDGICKQCGEGMETMEHLFFHCANARLVWKLAPVTWDGLHHHTFSFKEW